MNSMAPQHGNKIQEAIGQSSASPLVNKLKPGVGHTFRALRSRNYRLYFSGQCVSLVGTWMQQLAQSWLVYRLTNSVFLLGLVGFASQVPALFITPFAGVLIDKMNTRRILVATQTLSMVQALCMWLLVFLNIIDVWHIIVLSLFLGMVNALDAPARQSFVVEMIEKREDLVNAIALNSAMFNGARLIGPAIGGGIIALMGEGNCFLINGISYGAVIAALLAMRLPVIEKEKRFGNWFNDFKEGFRYTYGLLPFRSVLLMITLVNFVGVFYMVLLPVVARDILHGGAHTLGFLMGMIGAGALTSAFFLASRKNITHLLTYIPVATAAFLVGLLILSFSHSLWLDALFLFMSGSGLMLTMGSGNTLIQSLADDKKRGRVMGFYTFSFLGIAPFGNLLGGTLSTKIGVSWTMFFGSMITLAGLAIFLRYLPRIQQQANRILYEKTHQSI